MNIIFTLKNYYKKMSIKFTFYNNNLSLTTDSIPICILPPDSMLATAVNFPGADKECIRIQVSDPLSAVKCVRKLWNNVRISSETADYLQIHDSTCKKDDKVVYVYTDECISITSTGILINKNTFEMVKISALTSVHYDDEKLVLYGDGTIISIAYQMQISSKLQWAINKAIMQFMI